MGMSSILTMLRQNSGNLMQNNAIFLFLTQILSVKVYPKQRDLKEPPPINNNLDKEILKLNLFDLMFAVT